MERKRTRQVRVGRLLVGGGAPVTVQSMTKADTRDIAATTEEIRRLEEAGCEIIRLAVPDEEAARSLGRLRASTRVPLVADIHFDYRLAHLAVEMGVDKLRLNPGNIGSCARVREVARAASSRGIPIRIGVNAGSLERSLLEKYGRPTAEAMVESALGQVRLLEDLGFRDVVVSLKASDVPTTIKAYRLASEKLDYPLHLGVTEAGTAWAGTIRSAVGIGALLAEGIGDTIRVSLTADPVEEVRAGYAILKALGLRQRGPTVVSCPTCGRCELDLVRIAAEVERRLEGLGHPLRVAVMGCVVNGPGEAREADVGVAGGRGVGLIFRQGEIVRKVREEEMVDELCREAERLASTMEAGR